MDYTVNVNGMEVLIEKTDKTPTVSREELYNMYLDLFSDLDFNEKQKQLLKRIAFALNEEEANEIIFSIKDAKRNVRLATYACRLLDVPEIEERITPVLELMEEFEDVDFDKYESVFINGNEFTYEKDTLNIDVIADLLFKVGETRKGKRFSVEIDEEGVVISE